jgi:hypothetical protein
MINFLRKSKLNLINIKKPNSYIIGQLLPIKEKTFIEFVQIMEKHNLKVNFVKSKNFSGVSRSFFKSNYSQFLKNVYLTSIIIIFNKKNTNNVYNEYLEVFEKNSNLKIKNKIILLSFFNKGFFYNIKQFNNKIMLDKSLFNNFNISVLKIINTINLVSFRFIFICKNTL